MYKNVSGNVSSHLFHNSDFSLYTEKLLSKFLKSKCYTMFEQGITYEFAPDFLP